MLNKTLFVIAGDHIFLIKY